MSAPPQKVSLPPDQDQALQQVALAFCLVGTAAFLAWKGMSGGTPVQALALAAAVAYLGASQLAPTWVDITPDTVRIRTPLPVAWRRAIPRSAVVSVQLAPVGSHKGSRQYWKYDVGIERSDGSRVDVPLRWRNGAMASQVARDLAAALGVPATDALPTGREVGTPPVQVEAPPAAPR